LYLAPQQRREHPVDTQETSRILIVEDDERLATLTREYLEGNGFEVDVEGDGNRAVDRILNEK